MARIKLKTRFSGINKRETHNKQPHQLEPRTNYKCLSLKERRGVQRHERTHTGNARNVLTVTNRTNTVGHHRIITNSKINQNNFKESLLNYKQLPISV